MIQLWQEYCDWEHLDALVPNSGSWAEVEFGGAQLGDVRRTERLMRVAEALCARPTTSITDAMPEMAEWRGCYRFFSNLNVTPKALLSPHQQATYDRIHAAHLASSQEKLLVLAVQDTCLLDFTDHPATQGLGPLSIGCKRGLVMHSVLAFLPEGVPLGILGQDVWARDPESYGKGNYKQKSIEEKESFKWIRGLHATIKAHEHCPDVQFVSMGDREADVYDLFLQERPVNAGDKIPITPK